MDEARGPGGSGIDSGVCVPNHPSRKPSTSTRPKSDPTAAGLPGWALAGAAITVLAIVLEVAGNVFAGGVTSGYPGWLVTIAWPTPLRVLWWLAAAAGSIAWNVGIARANGRSRRLVTVITATPYVAFAVGVAVGAEWSTWH